MPTAEKKPQSGAHLFKRGMPRPPNAGRKAGTVNKTTATLKEAILKAAAEVGYDGNGQEGLMGYIKAVAERDMKSMCMLLGKVLPLQVTGADDAPIKVQITQDDANL